MIIKKLKLHNFGIYASDNTFIFNDEKPVTLIGGMNGRGKTTFLEAVLLALYGSNSFSVAESKFKSYVSYLRAHVNIDDGTNESYVELEFEMNEEDDYNTYLVNRSWNLNVKYTHDTVRVLKNGVEDKFLAQNWTMFIESVLPSGLANFFFFDGEKIAELADGETSPQIKNSIKSLLGINVIDLLQNDLKRIIKRLNNEEVNEYSTTKIDELRIIKEDKEDALIAIDEEISSLNNDIIRTNLQIQKKKREFEAKGGNVAELSRELYSERGILGGRLEQIQEIFIDLAATELPLVMVRPLLRKILVQSTKERDSKTMQLAVRKIEALFKLYVIENNNNFGIDNFISFIKSKTSSSSVENILNLSENSHIQCSLLVNSQLDNVKNNYHVNKETQEGVEKRINEIDNYLSVDIDEKAIQRIYKTICELENSKIELEVKLEAKCKERVSVNGECIKATTVFNRCVEHSLETMEREDDIERLKGYALMAQKTAEKYKVELQKSKVEELAITMTKCYKKLLGKQKLIHRIEMNAETLDYIYVDKNGKEISKNSLSAGEKQLMVISMLWALGKCSGKKLPVIIDTPLARLDSVHRTALIDKYFPKASEQTIILSTDAEIDNIYYGIIKSYVGNEFTLVYDDETKSSTIEEGYFKGVIG